ncbi:hypothetical protein PDE_06273 [Penicillium oxalicum 114-2]|uniref:Uncharacterized protein n=1 Tax=Penicillium oxalicum (strain 114-2 / CGMCC 5302) TaxID=933388 RepID=S8AY94_PENO1|nr:hypothetical protein PDE_06273 [Penicillium oxalicum 114-2]
MGPQREKRGEEESLDGDKDRGRTEKERGAGGG